ncbi:AAA family ATPase [Paraburkholderia hospita]|uniref:AAA family ATPase n=1 Tax=Paraburkholderia hospita TaxID=169430 RepID=UPI003ECFB49E
MDLSAYQLESLREDAHSSLYRARRRDHAASVLALIATRASSRLVARLEHEHALASTLDPAWAARPLALDLRNEPATLILADAGGTPLHRKLGRPLELGRFLRIAVSLASAVRHVHQSGLVHKDIKPANVLVDVNDQVRLTGFGIASLLPLEHQPPTPPEVVAGTFAYMAPEQTGRMNRSIDTRSDLYSLGVTLYEMLTGTLPFTASDPMEWIHCHIARIPPPPRERVHGVPEPVERIILKLMAKTAEERYQTAAGVEADLRSCLAAWAAHRHIEPFELGAHDASDRLLIPEKLYGREAQIESLVAAFDRIVAGGTTELVLIAGYAGIGKSSVVNELHKVLVPPSGLFAAGKFDQYKRDIPYITFAQAFQWLVRDLLSKSDDEVDPWRRALVEALAPNGKIIVNLIPELALIIGEQPPVPNLPPKDAQNLFHFVFRRFLGVFARPEHPLALFIDDLQWLDTATLELLEHLVTHPDVRHVLLVGAYRDNEVGASHPLTHTLESIRDAQGKVQQFTLAPLLPESVTQLVADSLHCDSATASPLAQLVHEKTGGNPFFTIQFLTTLHDEDLLRFDHGSAAWRWDLPSIRAKGFTDNVADLMAAKLGRLPVPTREALRQLACLGNVADVTALTWVQDGTEETTNASLWEAVRAGLVFRVGHTYVFAHDRVQEAAYALIPHGERAAAHLRIGRALASRTAPEAREEMIFDIVNHLNRGAALITSAAERAQTVALNLIAGKRAMNSTAYASARSYLEQAAALLPADAWTQSYESTLELYLALSECEYLVGDFAKADTLADMILDRARSNLDRSRVFSLRMELYQLAGKYDESFGVALAALRDFGIVFPDSDQGVQMAVANALREIPVNQAGRPVHALVDAPVADDPANRAIINLLVEAMPCAFAARPVFYPLFTLTAVNLSLLYGNTDYSSFAYGNFALFLVSRVADIPAAVQFSEMSLRLNDKFGNRRLYGKLLHLYCSHVNFWRCHISANLPVFERATTACMEVGDLVFAGNLAFNAVWQMIEKGEALEDVQTHSARYATLMQESHNDAVHETIRIERQFVASLQGKTAQTLQLNDDTFDEAACCEAIIRSNWGCGIGVYRIIKLMLAYIDCRYADALHAAAEAEAVISSVMALPIEATFYFFHVLTLTALYPDASAQQQQAFRAILDAKLPKFEMWATHGPENYGNRLALVRAELARIEGRDAEAMRHYEEAIRSAREHGFIQNQAMAYELAARFYVSRGSDKTARAYLLDARHHYLDWGADGKVRQLDRLHPHMMEEQVMAGSLDTVTTGRLDLATVIKVSQALSTEIVLPRLVEKLLRLAVENAGAGRGLLILLQADARGSGQGGGLPQVEAEATSGAGGINVEIRQRAVNASDLLESALHYVIRTKEAVLLDDALTSNMYSADDYVQRKRARSILCLPVIKQAKLIGVLYLENNLAPFVFTSNRVALLQLLASQAAISLENAQLYSDLQLQAGLLQRLPVSAWTLKPDGTPDFVNQVWLDYSGQTLDFVRSHPEAWMTAVHPDDREAASRTFWSGVRSGQGFTMETRSLRARDQSYRWHLQQAVVLHDAEGKVLKFIGTTTDIDDRKRVEDALRQAQADLARINRATTMGELAASLAHEIMQPIAATILGAKNCLRWIDRDEPDLDEARATVIRVAEDGQRAAAILVKIRRQFEKDVLKREILDPSAIIQETVGLLRSEAAQYDISISTELAAGLPRIVGDPVQLQQVVMNLIVNSIEAMKDVDGIREMVIRSQCAENAQILVSVRDTGSGIAPQLVEQIFDPFFTTKPHGTGMGLRISRSIVDSHGGRLWVTQAPGRGAVFQFTLPVADADGD